MDSFQKSCKSCTEQFGCAKLHDITQQQKYFCQDELKHVLCDKQRLQGVLKVKIFTILYTCFIDRHHELPLYVSRHSHSEDTLKFNILTWFKAQLLLTYLNCAFPHRGLNLWAETITVIDGSWVAGGAPAQTQITNSSVSGCLAEPHWGIYDIRDSSFTPVEWCEAHRGDAGVKICGPLECIPLSD